VLTHGRYSSCTISKHERVIALALYRHKSIGEVLDDLGLALPDAQAPFVSKSAAAQARQRLGPEPVQWLFERSARAGCEQDRRTCLFNGLQLFAMDGTTLRTHDTAENRAHFGAQSYVGETVASYPQVRGVTLTALPTHLIRNAVFGPYGINEMLYAKQLVADIPADSLTVFDRDFLSADILCALTSGADNRHFLIPAKSNTKWEVLEGDAQDAVVRMRVSPQARATCPELPEFWEARAITVIDQKARKRVLLTSLRDRRRYRPADIAACYERRWGIEASYRELRQTLTIENCRRRVSGDLGHADSLQSDPARDSEGCSARQMRTVRGELHPGLPPDSIRTALGSRHTLLR
jgi:hypothetical protein